MAFVLIALRATAYMSFQFLSKVDIMFVCGFVVSLVVFVLVTFRASAYVSFHFFQNLIYCLFVVL